MNRRQLFITLLAAPIAAIAAVKPKPATLSAAERDELIRTIKENYARALGMTLEEAELHSFLNDTAHSILMAMMFSCRDEYDLKKMEAAGNKRLNEFCSEGKLRSGFVEHYESWYDSDEEKQRCPRFAMRLDHPNGKSYGYTHFVYLPKKSAKSAVRICPQCNCRPQVLGEHGLCKECSDHQALVEGFCT